MEWKVWIPYLNLTWSLSGLAFHPTGAAPPLALPCRSSRQSISGLSALSSYTHTSSLPTLAVPQAEDLTLQVQMYMAERAAYLAEKEQYTQQAEQLERQLAQYAAERQALEAHLEQAEVGSLGCSGYVSVWCGMQWVCMRFTRVRFTLFFPSPLHLPMHQANTGLRVSGLEQELQSAVARASELESAISARNQVGVEHALSLIHTINRLRPALQPYPRLPLSAL
jgi:hypothetical protein